MINSNFSDLLLDDIRLQITESYIKCDNSEIVPKVLTHSYLINNFNISESILQFYYSICSDLISISEYDYLVSNGYKGEIETTLKPYSICYKGAFINRKQIWKRIKWLKQFPLKWNDKQINNLSDLFPYLDEYSNGFKEGFNNFELDNINIFLNDYSDKNDRAKLIYEFISERKLPNVTWQRNYSLFWYSEFNNLTRAFEDGKEQGYFYKAWSIILSNSRLFEEFFIPNKIHSEEFMLNLLISSCQKLQNTKMYYQCNEDDRTTYVYSLIDDKCEINEQAFRGVSESGLSAGRTDGVLKCNGINYMVEAINLTYLDKANLKTHINKLENNYDNVGLKVKFILVYINTPDNSFGSFVTKYEEFLNNNELFVYNLVAPAKLKELDSCTNLRVLESIHIREGKEVKLYHILIKFPKKAV